MIKEIYATYDMQAGYFDAPMVFDTPKLAIAGLRRSIRNMYLKKEVTYDELKDRQLVYLGTYDTISGKFANCEEEVERFNFASFVGDLVGDVNEV